jgi:hypothetical protein
MHLEVDGARLPIAQLGPDFVILAETTECRSRQARIALQVDSTEERWKVELPDGLAAVGQRTRIVNLT